MEADESSSYFCKTKFMNNYSFMFEEELKAIKDTKSKEAELTRLNIQGRYIKSNFEANKRFTSVDSFKAAIEQGIQLWDIACIRDMEEEDNDTDDEDEEEEEADDE